MKNINKKIWIVLGIILSVCFIFIGTLTVIINGDKICKNTYINDTNIGELTNLVKNDILSNINYIQIIILFGLLFALCFVCCILL